jgi:hypothetical protein
MEQQEDFLNLIQLLRLLAHQELKTVMAVVQIVDLVVVVQQVAVMVAVGQFIQLLRVTQVEMAEQVVMELPLLQVVEQVMQQVTL